MYKNGRKLTLSMIVKNEADRYLRRALEHHREYIDEAVIIDNGSKDHTINICKEVLAGIPTVIISNTWASFSNEFALRAHQWNETLASEPEWVLNMDADEWFEEGAAERIRHLINQDKFDTIYLRLYDMWNETHYRDDQYWRAHSVYRPFFVRASSGTQLLWKKAALHVSRFPTSIQHMTYLTDELRVCHYGWAREQDRITKYNRYLTLDPQGEYGWKEQYDSILDQNPNLVKWEE